MSWSNAELKVVSPPARGGHSSVIVAVAQREFLVVFGGADPFGITTADVVVVDTSTFVATHIVGTKGDVAQDRWPSPRCGHSATSAPGGSKFFVFAGFAPLPTPTLFNDVWEGTVTLEKDNDSPVVAWRRIATSGAAPGPRNSHSMVALGENFIVTLGGSDNTQPQADAHCLDINSGEWKALELPGSFVAREMSSVVDISNFFPGKPTTTVLWCGGKTNEGLLDDGLVLELDPATGEFASAPMHLPALIPPACGQTAAVYSSDAVIVVGGFLGGDPNAQSTDRLISFAEGKLSGGDAVERRDAKGEALSLGLGHSMARSADGRILAVTGILPDTVSAPLEVRVLQGRA